MLVKFIKTSDRTSADFIRILSGEDLYVMRQQWETSGSNLKKGMYVQYLQNGTYYCYELAADYLGPRDEESVSDFLHQVANEIKEKISRDNNSKNK